MPGNEKILAAFVLKDFKNAKQEILLATKKGMIKRTIEDLETKINSKPFRIMKLSDGDELVSASLVTSKTKYVVMLTKSGYSVKYDISEIPSAGPNAKGVKSSSSKDELIIAGKSFDSGNVLIMTDKGNIKKIKLDLVPLMTRPKKVALFNVSDKDVLNVLDEEDKMTEIKVKTFAFSDLESVNSDLDMPEIIASTLEKTYIIKNGDHPPLPKTGDEIDKKENIISALKEEL
ncbi:hypothetical protein FQR65_LT16619 [Abscondita terminalis]|nr:hypothetical protein FQR65_LT16619 [Abscondita terminalis]